MDIPTLPCGSQKQMISNAQDESDLSRLSQSKFSAIGNILEVFDEQVRFLQQSFATNHLSKEYDLLAWLQLGEWGSATPSNITIVNQAVPNQVVCDAVTLRIIRFLDKLFYHDGEMVLRRVAIEDNAITIAFIAHAFDCHIENIELIQQYFELKDSINHINYFKRYSWDDFINHLDEYDYICREINTLLKLCESQLIIERLSHQSKEVAPTIQFKLKIPQPKLQVMSVDYKGSPPRVLFIDHAFSSSLAPWLQHCVDFPLILTSAKSFFRAELMKQTKAGYMFASIQDIHSQVLPEFEPFQEFMTIQTDPRIACDYQTIEMCSHLLLSADPNRVIAFKNQHKYIFTQAQNVPFNILYIEDNLAHGHKVQQQFANVAKIQICNDPDEALDYLIEHNNVDLILVDLGLDKYTGLGFMNQRPEHIRHIPCVIYSANLFPNINYKKFGFCDFIIKGHNKPIVNRVLYTIANYHKNSEFRL